MPKPLMLVIMSVRLTRRIGAAVLMLMMFVMDMGMSVRDWLMDVFVLVMLRQVQPNSKCHENACNSQLRGNRIAEHEYGGHAPEKRGG